MREGVVGRSKLSLKILGLSNWKMECVWGVRCALCGHRNIYFLKALDFTYT